MSSKEINEMRKAGRLDEAMQMAEYEFAANPGRFEAIALFWCLNDQLKITPIEQRPAIVLRMQGIFDSHGKENEVMEKVMKVSKRMCDPEYAAEKEGWEIYHSLRELDIKDIDSRKRLLFDYLQLGYHKPSLMHSLIMGEAVKMEKCSSQHFVFPKFADMWGLENLREEDWEQFHNQDGRRFSSLAEKVIGAYIKGMDDDNITPSEAFRTLLAKAIERYPSNLHLPRYKAQIAAHDGDIAGAIEQYKVLLQRTPDKFYLWDDMSDLVSDPDLKMGFMCGALLTFSKDEFTVNIRQRLADLFCNRQMYGEAKSELDRVRQVYADNHWPLKSKFQYIYNRLPKNTLPKDPRFAYNHYKALADSFIYSSLPSIVLVKTWEKKDEAFGKVQLQWQMRCDQDSFWIKPKKYKLNFRLPNGSVFVGKVLEAKVKAGETPKKQLAWVEESQLTEDLPWLRRASGPLEIVHKPGNKVFGFVDNVFVPSNMLYGLTEGTTVTVLAIKNGDKWGALSIIDNR